MKYFLGQEGQLLASTTSIDRSDQDRLLRHASRLEKEVLTLGRRGLRCGRYVGAADFGWAQLEILPKLDQRADTRSSRRFLHDLLSASGLVPRPFVKVGRTNVGSSGLLEPLRRAFAERLYSLLVDGPPRRYHERSEVSEVLRGRVIFAELSRKLPTERFRLPVRHAPLHYNNGLARLLRSLAAHLSATSRSMETRALLDRCDRLLLGVDVVSLREAVAAGVNLSRFEAPWKPFVQLAETLVEGSSPTPVAAGTQVGFSLLFPLHDVFERMLRRTLRLHPPSSLSLSPGGRRRKLLHPLPQGEPTVALRPDFLFTDPSGEPTLIGDAKWKLLDLGKSGFGISPSDLYQISTYLAVHNVEKGLLFFPSVPGMSGESPWYRRYRLAGQNTVLTILGVDVEGLVSRDSLARAQALQELHEGVRSSVEGDIATSFDL